MFPIGSITAPAGFALLGLISLSGTPSAKDYSLNTRDIGCSEVTIGRSRQICDAISVSLTWQWMGHAVISPGYKPTFEGIRKVYCEQKLGKSDAEVLKILKTYDPKRKWRPDWRLESGADMLLRIVSNVDGTGDEPITSVFNPNNPDYVLRSGC